MALTVKLNHSCFAIRHNAPTTFTALKIRMSNFPSNEKSTTIWPGWPFFCQDADSQMARMNTKLYMFAKPVRACIHTVSLTICPRHLLQCEFLAFCDHQMIYEITQDTENLSSLLSGFNRPKKWWWADSLVVTHLGVKLSQTVSNGFSKYHSLVRLTSILVYNKQVKGYSLHWSVLFCVLY